MSRHLLDTNPAIALIARRSVALLAWVEACEPGSLVASAIAARELWYGVSRSRKVEFNLETVRLLFADLAIVDPDREDPWVAGMITADLARQETSIGPYDLLIAGQAKARGLTLVTVNAGEFSRTAGLRLEDWAAK